MPPDPSALPLGHSRQSATEPIYTAPLALTDDEEQVLHDLVGVSEGADMQVIESYRNALNTLRIKALLRFTAARGVDVSEATGALRYIVALARRRDEPVRLHFDFDASKYALRVGERDWSWGVLDTLLPRAARELGWVRDA